MLTSWLVFFIIFWILFLLFFELSHYFPQGWCLADLPIVMWVIQYTLVEYLQWYILFICIFSYILRHKTANSGSEMSSIYNSSKTRGVVLKCFLFNYNRKNFDIINLDINQKILLHHNEECYNQVGDLLLSKIFLARFSFQIFASCPYPTFLLCFLIHNALSFFCEFFDGFNSPTAPVSSFLLLWFKLLLSLCCETASTFSQKCTLVV